MSDMPLEAVFGPGVGVGLCFCRGTMGSVNVVGISEHQAREYRVPKVMAIRMPSPEIHRKWNPGGLGKVINPRWKSVLGISPVWFRVILWNRDSLGHSALDSRGQYNTCEVSLEVALPVLSDA